MPSRSFSPVNPPWHYRAYDLHIVSDFELPELCAGPQAAPDQAAPDQAASDSTDAPDVTIVLGATLGREALEDAQQLHWGERHCCLWFQVARFTISHGDHVLVEPVEGYSAAAWRVPLLGSTMAALLDQRGAFVLHAGALIFESGAAAFLGDKGQGKSTLNAALSHAGFPLLNDDVTALQMPDDPADAPLALPGFSQIKLLPDAVRAATATDPDQWPTVAPEIADFDKRAFLAPLSPHGAPLRALFVLQWAPNETNNADSADTAHSTDTGHSADTADNAHSADNADTADNAHSADNADTAHSADSADNADNADTAHSSEADGLRLRRLSAQQALAQLIPHTFGARFGAGYLEGERRRTHFFNCARLVSVCPVWELTRPRDLTLLPATIDLITRVMAEDYAV